MLCVVRQCTLTCQAALMVHETHSPCLQVEEYLTSMPTASKSNMTYYVTVLRVYPHIFCSCANLGLASSAD